MENLDTTQEEQEKCTATFEAIDEVELKVEEPRDPTIVLAQAIHELAAATKLRNEARTTKLTLFTPSTGGELALEWDTTMTDEQVAEYITKELGRRESTLKACVKQNAENGIGQKAAK